MLSLGFAELLLVMPVSVCDAFPVTRMLTLMLVLLMLMLHCIGFPVSLLVLGIALATSVCYHPGNIWCPTVYPLPSVRSLATS